MMSPEHSIALSPKLSEFINRRKAEFEQIPASRKTELDQLADYIRDTLHALNSTKLVFICTHNSRRSHLSQIWAKVAADSHGFTGVMTYSGGTEATAMNPRVVESLKRSGFQVEAEDADVDNPVYLVHYSDGVKPLRCFSKVFDQSPNPTSGYCAVMTCSSADQACPVVTGCDLRAPIRYEDPKVADDTPQEAEVYDKRSGQICREMFYMISRV